MKRCLPLFALFVSSLALAHPGHAESTNFLEGFLHPLSGFDHLFAMLAVGLWSARQHQEKPSSALLVPPAAFVFFLLVGIILGSINVGLPAIEPLIAVSLLVLGLLAGIRKQIPHALALAIIALFATVHGYAHGAELGNNLPAIVGITAASALLHLAGIALGLNQTLRRVAAVITAGGAFFLLQLV